MIRFWSICHNTFVQTLRQPIFTVLLLVTMAMLVLGVPQSNFAVDTNYQQANQWMLQSMGLYTLLVSGLLLAAFSASGAIGREIEDKTALTVVSKPVARSTFVLGKFAGVALAVTMGFYVCSIVYLMTVRHHVMPAAWNPYDWPVITLGVGAFVLAVAVAMAGNYLFGWPFLSTGVWSATLLFTLAAIVLVFVGKDWQLVPPGYETLEKQAIDGQLLISVALSYLAVLFFVAVAVASSTRLGQVLTLLVCLGLLLAGSLHGFIMARWQDNLVLARLGGLVLPKLTLLLGLETASRGKVVPLSYLGMAVLYTLAWCGAALGIGVSLFQKRQMDAEGASAVMPGLTFVLAAVGRLAAAAMFLVGVEALLGAGARFWQGWRGPSWLLPQSLQPMLPGWMSLLLVVAVAAWLLWGYFGRGVGWSWWLVMVLAAAALIGGGVAWAMNIEWQGGSIRSLASGLAIAAAAATVAILLLPGTRRHFASVRLARTNNTARIPVALTENV